MLSKFRKDKQRQSCSLALMRKTFHTARKSASGQLATSVYHYPKHTIHINQNVCVDTKRHRIRRNQLVKFVDSLILWQIHMEINIKTRTQILLATHQLQL